MASVTEIPGSGRRHVEQRAFVERRHEFGAELVEEHGHGDAISQHGDADRQPLVFKHELDHRLIDLHQRAADGMLFFAADLAHKNGIHDLGQPLRDGS